jgi:hypothetical protein
MANTKITNICQEESKQKPPSNGKSTGAPVTPVKSQPNIIKGKNLRSKHLRIISKDIYFGSLGSSVDIFRSSVDGYGFDSFITSQTGDVSSLIKDVASGQVKSSTTEVNKDTISFDVPSSKETKALSDFEKYVKGKEFVYLNFVLDVPFSQEEVRQNQVSSGRPDHQSGFVDNDPRISTFQSEFVYNFYLRDYEKLIERTNQEEWIIPNAHMFSFLKESLTDQDVKNFDKEYLELMSYGGDEVELKNRMNTINFSFQEYQNGYLPAKENYFKNAPQTTKNKAKNYVVTQDDVIEYNQLAEQYRGGANFGFYLEFPYEPPTLTGKEDDLDDFKNLFKKTNTDLNLYDLVIRSEGNTTQRVGGQLTQESVNNLTARSISKFDSLEYISQLSFVEFGNVGKAKLPLDFSLDKVDYKTWDLTGFFLDYKKQSQTVLKNILNIANNKNVTVLGESSEAIQKYQNNTTYKFFQDLMLEAANIGFKNLVNKNSLTAKQCFIDSSETPHEILFYKIIKKDRNGNQLQTFILPSPAEESKTRRKLLNFFDAQVKYDKQYEYEINAYPLVLAKKYSYFPVLDTSRVVLSDELRFSVFFKFMSYFVVDFIKTMNFKIVGNKLNYDFKVISQVIKDYINNFPKKSKQAFQDSKSKIIFFGILAEIQLDFDNLLKKIENSLDFSKINSTSKISITELSTIKTVVAKHYFNQSIFSYRKTAAIPRDPQVGKKLSFLLGGFKYDEEVAQLFLDKFTPGTINLQGVKLKTSEAKLLTISGDFTKLEKELASLYINLNPINFDKLEAKVEDYIVLMEVPLFSIEGKVLENPPIYPEVHFSGVKGKNNQIFISLKTQTTRMYEKPIPFNDIEEDYFNNLIKSKGTDRNGRLLFKTDDENRKFQIFRLEERPKSYKDFDQQIRREIDLQGKYAGATYRDRLLPNKKYYYTFRSMDVHDNLSNPSPVYEVVVNDQAGFIFPEFKVIQLEDKDYYQYTQSFRKYLEIKPSFENTIIDTDITDNFKSAYGLGLGGVAPLGSGVDNAWGKKFKVRITSKSSGKKVDINFDFTKKYVGDVVTASDVAGYGVISEEDRTNMATLPESERPTQELGQSTPILEDSDFFKRKEE